MKTGAYTRARRGDGFTLVELMVALTIGLLLTLVVAQLFVGSRRTFATTDELSRMQETIRFSTHVLTRAIHQAGYLTSPNTEAKFIFAAPNLAIEGVPGAGALPDGITLRFQGNNNPTIQNCRGQAILGGVMSENRYTIENVATIDAGVPVQVPSLVCRTNTDNFVGQYVVVPNVENMKILYGEDRDGDQSVERFVPWGTPGLIVANIRVVRVAMLFRSGSTTTGTSIQPVAMTWTLNGQAVNTNDARVRRDVAFTAGVRNQSN